MLEAMLPDHFNIFWACRLILAFRQGFQNNLFVLLSDYNWAEIPNKLIEQDKYLFEICMLLTNKGITLKWK